MPESQECSLQYVNPFLVENSCGVPSSVSKVATSMVAVVENSSSNFPAIFLSNDQSAGYDKQGDGGVD
jgi:hypothetical protein